MRVRRLSAWVALLCLASLPAAQAQKSANTLRIAWRDAIPDLDPYHNQLRTGFVLAHQVWDTLVYRDPDTFQLKPLLATAWRQTGDTTFEFELRRGVTFHDGSPFTADDVVYTVNSVLADKQVAIPSNYAYLAGAERIDDFHVRITLKQVYPAALESMAMTLPILPRGYRERVGAAGFSQAPVGTGPFKVAAATALTEIDLDRNDSYYDGPKGHPALAHVLIHEVKDGSDELAQLLSGQADWIWQFDPAKIETIARVPSLQAVRAESMRIGYLQFDAAGRSGADNPLTKLKVRQAIAHAVDRLTLARQLAGGGSRVLDAACFPTQFGCDQTAVSRYDYDPALAKKLLAEAGYPDGFDTEIVSDGLPQYTTAVQSYLKVIGVNAHIVQVSASGAVDRREAGQNPLTMGSWGSYSINDVSSILPVFFDGGGSDYSRDPSVKTLIDAGDSTTDPDERRKDYTQALRRVADQMYWLPLNTYVTTYAFSRELNFKPYQDEIPRFFLASWK